MSLALAIAVPCLAQAPAPYQDLYAQLGKDVADLQAAIPAAPPSGTAYAGQLTDANCNNGPALLQPSSMALIDSEILLLKAIGVKAISVEVSYPMLDPNFFGSIGHPEYQGQFTTFYANVAAAIRAQGLQVIVERQSMIPTGLQSKWGAPLQNYYAGIASFDAYETARAQTAALVAQTMKPDYFVLQEEPDTEAAQSGQASAGTASGSTDMLSRSLSAVRQTNIAGMKVGAGFGSWLQAYPLFANGFTRQRCGQMVSGQTQPCITGSLDFLDLHLFPITEQTVDCSTPPNPKACTAPNFGQNAIAIVNTAKAVAMPMSISQTWLRKVRDAEWLQINGDIQEAREAYDFWEPLDLAFLRTVVALANDGRMLFVAPFNTQSFSAYLPWSSSTALQGEGGNQTPSQVFAAVQSLALSNAPAAVYTSVATGFHDLIVSDTVPPSVPANVTVTRPSSTTATVTWTPSTDNVGVAGYHILRNGTQIASVFEPPFQDSGLASNVAYSYQVEAFDLAGNVSRPVKHRAAKH